MRLKVKMPASWIYRPNQDKSPPYLFYRHQSSTPGPLQISWVETSSTPGINPSRQELQQMVSDFGQKNGYGALVESSCDSCVFGSMATATFRSPKHPRIQIWFLSNGQDMITATHICEQQPDPIEVSEAQEIVRMLTLGPEKPKPRWKFW
jgi:hypothetical protein